MLKGYRDFLLRGNVIDLAVAVVVGAAFNGIITALVRDFISPLIGVWGGTANFSGFTLKVGKATFMIGDFINALISFVIVSTAIYFIIVLPMNTLMKRVKGQKSTVKKCPECLSLIPSEARRCKFCTAVIGKN